MGHEVLWVLRDCLSGESLLARSLLGATEAALVLLLREVAGALPVPIGGVISDGQASIRNAVRAALPDVPHQLCQFHYLREAAKPVFEADRHAKVLLKKEAHGVRPIERALEGRDDAEPAAVRGCCLAVCSALTDDGHPPLCAAGLRLHDRLAAIHASVARVAVKGGRAQGTRAAAAAPRPWPARHGGPVAAIRTAYGWVHQAAHLLADHEARPGAAVQAAYQTHLATTIAACDTTGPLAAAISHFGTVTASYGDQRFPGYDVPDLPRTNNALEQCFGSVRYHERRATGRKGASPGLVVRGAVRLVATVGHPRAYTFGGPDLQPADLAAWAALRATALSPRPHPDLAVLELALTQRSLPA